MPHVGVLAAVLLMGVCPFAAMAQGIPRLGQDRDGGPVFQLGDAQYVFWGVDADTWKCEAGDVEHFRKHCEASVDISANYIVIPVTWKSVERPDPGTYDFTYVDRFLEVVREHGLKAGIIWAGIDYAAGDPNFVPPYIDADPDTYTRITGFQNDRLHCPSCPATLERERAAYEALMQHVAETDRQRTVMAINLCGEINFVRAIEPWQSWKPEQHVRCTCRHCDAAYQDGEDPLEFMTRQYARYVMTLLEAGARYHDIPTYSPVCAHKWFPGWRYAEDPVFFKRFIDRANHFVCPTIAQTVDEKTFVEEEMDHFLPERIPGNLIFVDGIDTGWPANLSHIELAPWYSILHYGGLGAVYWDAPSVSIVHPDEPRRALFRVMWGPLKAMHYHLARLKSAGDDTKFWWPYHETTGEGILGPFTVRQQSSDRDYGVCFRLADDRLTFTATTAGGPCTVTLRRTGGFSSFAFERGCFDMVTGDWRQAEEIAPALRGDEATVVLDGDSGDFTRAACLVYGRIEGPDPAGAPAQP